MSEIDGFTGEFAEQNKAMADEIAGQMRVLVSNAEPDKWYEASIRFKTDGKGSFWISDTKLVKGIIS
jgi:hypothetical protein